MAPAEVPPVFLSDPKTSDIYTDGGDTWGGSVGSGGTRRNLGCVTLEKVVVAENEIVQQVH